jgi:hypothetical protein
VACFRSFYGVDFSGARLAGRTAWLARLSVPSPPRRRPVLTSLHRLDRLCRTPHRAEVLARLVRLIADSQDCLWAMDFCFGFPLEVLPEGATWADQLAWVGQWDAGAYALGLECVARARQIGERMHIRRQTDADVKAPFDCYHYRIIYQTFHGIRDVLTPLRGTTGTAIVPFEYRRVPRATRVLVEACPASTLKRLGLPHQNYKQPEGGPLTPKRRRTRRTILDGLSLLVRLDDTQRLVMMRNPGGDALDAALAAVGAMQTWEQADHAAVARHPRYRREGFIFA